ncbi:TPA: DUF3343 domain-containing protein [Escherichia coli O146]|nr:DUF3343 domain-containing protein [Escherichia coli O146]HBC3151633.1 DUF3343 domain-containing protein [Escherichia coli O146]HBC3223964.1 DUF3343 domain-containing protein [Escherichia coli O146]HBC3229406.1 DUF3343 domain-containing protein [Escherichia coli O146]
MTYNYVFLFHVQHELKKIKTRLKKNSVVSSVIDAPRQITTECEIALKVQFLDENTYLKYTSENIREIWLVNDTNYKQVWVDETG